MELSIIVPVYNVEKYIKRCIGSVTKQNYDDYELILIDDGSTDGSGKLCDEMAQNNKHIIVIHKANGGLSSARNAGLKQAHGQYIMFLDSDDWIEDGCLSIFSRLFKQGYDLIMGRAWTIDDEGHKKSKIEYRIPTGEYCVSESIGKLTAGNVTFCSPFYIYRRDYINNHSLTFFEGILHEDELWMPIALLNAKTIYISDVYFYYHYIRVGSIMHSDNNERSARSTLIVCEKLINEFKKYPYIMTRNMKNRVAMLFLRAVPQLKEPDQIIKTFGKSMPIKYSLFGKQKIKALLFGTAPKAYCRLVKRIRGYS